MYYILILLGSIISLTLTYIIRLVAIRNAIIDIPNQRSSHSVPTPRGGGLAIAITWYFFLVLWYLFGNLDINLFLAFLAGIIIVVVGFIDDIKSLPPKIRILSQVVTASLGLFFLGGLRIIDIGFMQIEIPWYLNIIVIFGMLWMINLFNFLDGTDGYLGGEGVFIFLSMFIFTGDFLALTFAACIFGFLIWNWPKAKIFCGDAGSTLIGYTIMIFAINYQNTHKISVIIPLILSGLFWIDATITLVRRWLNKEKLSEAHRKHAYQRLVQSGLSHKQVLLIGIGVNIALFSLSYIAYLRSQLTVFALIIATILVVLFVKYADFRKPFSR